MPLCWHYQILMWNLQLKLMQMITEWGRFYCNKEGQLLFCVKHQQIKISLSIYEKEMLAIMMAFQKWRPYILARQFKIKTDHYSLKFLYQRITTPTQQKWSAKLMGYDFEIIYKKG